MKTNGTKFQRSVHSEQNLLEGFTRHVLHIDRVIECTQFMAVMVLEENSD